MILSQQIQPSTLSVGVGRTLIGRKGFYFEEPNDSNSGSTGGVNTGAEGGMTADPFKDIDLNLVDQATRDAIESARQTLKTNEGRVATATKLQSERDQLAAQVQKQQQDLQQLQSQSNRPTNDRGQDLTFEQELEQLYIAEGMEAPAAKRAAQVNAKVHTVALSRFEKRLGNQLAPVVGNVVESHARNAFEQAQESDQYGIFQNNEVAQRVWERSQQMAQQGEMPSAEVLLNFAKIYAWEHGLTPNANPATPIPPSGDVLTRGNMNSNTKFTFPGASSGNHVRMPGTINGNGNEPMDPETHAALAATFSNWEIKPKAFRNGTEKINPNVNGGQSHKLGKITRGGMAR